ncbi:disease resistance protein Pik-2 [Aegilops tauschii subsp. strangulata]
MESTALSIGKAVLSGAIGYASSAAAEEVALQLGIQADHAFIRDELEMMQAFLMAAHEEPDDNRVVKTWVKQVRDVSYNVEDCLQDFAVRLEDLSWWRIPCTLLDRRSVAKEMKELRAQVEDVSQRNTRYRLIKGSGSRPATTGGSSSIPTEEVLLHIAEATRTTLQEKKKVDLAQMIADDVSDLRTIAVWGASSDLGVTSIIRAAYDNQYVREKFQCRAWVRLTHPFNPSDFFVSLVRQFYEDSYEKTGKTTEGTTTGLKVLEKMSAQDNLVDEFNRYVTEKRYLVVITDVSTIEEWDWIKTYFPRKNGSRIIVSTQQFEVASLCTEKPYSVSEIDQKWSLDKDFYVFYKKVDAPTKEYDKPESSSKADIGTAEPDGKEHVQKPSHESTVAVALEEDQLIDRAAAKAKVAHLVDQGGQVITICGMGGLGKTTLVRSVYQQELGERFQRRAWLTMSRFAMSRSFNYEEFLRDLFHQLRSDHNEEKEFADVEKTRDETSGKESKPEANKEHTETKLTKIASEHKCLIVLDDLSSFVDWTLLKKLLLGNISNRIIVTTRELTVAKCCSVEGNQIYNLELLNEEEALNLFKKKVFKDIKERENYHRIPDLIEQAKLILKKCGGLPLAISTIGSYLATKPKTAMEWRSLNKHISAELEMNPELGMIKTVLTTSYDGLPYPLKFPFLYLSIFPANNGIRWKRLVRRWVVEGYSRGIHNKTAEEIGESYITDLINRSMVRPSSKGTTHRSGRVGFLEVHDLIREVGTSKSTEENLVFTLEEGSNLDIQGKIRHLAVSSSWTRDKNAFEIAFDLSHLRSLTIFAEYKPFFISDKMRLLRVLDLEDTNDLTSHQLHQIGKLRHLNYLSLRRCYKILRLPNSLGNLRHLQTLDVRDTGIINLPRSITKLQKLQYVRVGYVPGDDHKQREEFQDNTFAMRKCSFSVGNVIDVDEGLGLGGYFCYWWCWAFGGVLLCLLCMLAGVGFLLFVALFIIGRFSWVLMKDGFDGLPVEFMGLDPNGVKFPRGIRKLKSLRTLGVVNIDAGSSIIEDLQYLTDLRKLRVTGLNKKNYVKFFWAIAKHKCLESLLMRAEGEPGFYGCLDDLSSPPKNLQSLKLYGNLVKLPKWIHGLKDLVKLELGSSRILEHNDDIQSLGKLPNLAILRLLKESFVGKEVRFVFHREAFPSLVVLKMDLVPNLESVKFEEGATPKLELLQFRSSITQPAVGLFSGLASLPNLKEFILQNCNSKDLVEDLRCQLARNQNQNRPVLKTFQT